LSTTQANLAPGLELRGISVPIGVPSGVHIDPTNRGFLRSTLSLPYNLFCGLTFHPMSTSDRPPLVKLCCSPASHFLV